ncbi:zinc-binding dehydrogenase [Glutamicibacter mishrai]|nr:zinc-binding dehydrogenase [Glutamicibacter mishrai]
MPVAASGTPPHWSLPARGASVALVARRKDRLATLVAEIEAAGGSALALATDIADRDQAFAAVAAPLMCAGVTVWEPLRAMNVGLGTRVAVVGLGGLGHLAVKLAVVLGADTTVISRTADKAEDVARLGSQRLLLSTDEAAMSAVRGQFDVILDTVAVNHELAPYLSLLALDGELCLLGYLGDVSLAATDQLIGRKKLSSAGSGDRRRTAELLEFCAEHQVVADVEVLPSTRVEEALERLARGDVRYRFVLDMSDLDD